MPRQKSTHIDSPAAVGRRLKAARERVGVSQRALSFTGCSPAYISRIEAGERIPSLQLLRELGKRLGVTEDYLATGETASALPSSVLRDAEIALRLDDLEQAERLYEQVLAGVAVGDVKSGALEGLGRIAAAAGRPAEAIERLEQALELVGGDPSARPYLAECLGRAYATLGELAPAIALFERCVDRFEREGSAVEYVRFACLLGYALTDNGDFAGAERIVAKALAAGREIGDPYTRARLYWSQSRLLIEQGKSDVAERYARKALETLRATEDTYALGHAHQLLARVYLDSGRPAEAAEVLREGRPLVAASATPIELAHYDVEEARALAALGETEQAAGLAMSVAGRLGDAKPLDAGRTFVLLGDLFTELGDTARARELYELGVELLERQAPSRYLVDAYKRLGGLLENEGRAKEALETLKRALGVQERAGRPLV